jgi:hypothetical protein
MRRTTTKAGTASLFLNCFLAAVAPAMAETPLHDEALDEIRAGYVSVEGIAFAFAAEARSFVDGRLALESHLRIDGEGRRETIGPTVTLPGVGGVTTFSHHFGDHAFRTVVVNTASDRVLRQELIIAIAVPDLARFQQQVGEQQRLLRLVDAMTVNLRDSVVR